MTARFKPQESLAAQSYTKTMGGSSFQDTHAPLSGDDGDDRFDANAMPEDPEDTPGDRLTPSATRYLALAVALLSAATLLAVATIGVPGTEVHVSGVPAMVTSALSTLMAAGALLALRSGFGARRHRL